MAQTLRQRLITMTAKARLFTRRYIPPGLRLPIGLVLVIGGIFGFLPILGFWMIPLGVAVAALDVKPIWRYVTRQRSDPSDEP